LSAIADESDFRLRRLGWLASTVTKKFGAIGVEQYFILTNSLPLRLSSLLAEITPLLLNINRIYKIHAGIKIVGL